MAIGLQIGDLIDIDVVSETGKSATVRGVITGIRGGIFADVPDNEVTGHLARLDLIEQFILPSVGESKWCYKELRNGVLLPDFLWKK